MPERAKFIIELELDTLEEMSGIFQRLDVEFDPVENMVCLSRDGARYAILTGKDVEEVLRECNAHLQERGHPRRFREEFREMRPKTRRDLMEFLVLGTVWGDGRTLEEIDPLSLEDFQGKHPEALRTA